LKTTRPTPPSGHPLNKELKTVRWQDSGEIPVAGKVIGDLFVGAEGASRERNRRPA